MHVGTFGKKFLRSRLRAGHARVKALCLVLVVLGGVVVISRSTGAVQTASQPNDARTAAVVADTPRKDVVQRAELQPTAPSAQLPAAPPSMAPPIANQIPASDCSDKVAALEKALAQQLKQHKKDLDAKLSGSFYIPLHVSANIVDEYNTQVTDIYNQYYALATTEQCTLYTALPQSLPNTYPN